VFTQPAPQTKFRFKTKPFQHQLSALNMSCDEEFFGLLMEQGTGKSKVLADNIAHLYAAGKIDAALIIAPKGVFRNWSDPERGELRVHLPDEVYEQSVIVPWSPDDTRKNFQRLNILFEPDPLRLFILVMNVEALATEKGLRFAARFLNCHHPLVAVDESTTIKNPRAKRTRAILRLGRLARFRRILTGTPVTQSPLDVYSQFAFLHEDALGFSSYFAFRNRYAVLRRRVVSGHSFDEVVGYQRLEELQQRLKKHSYRVLKRDCLDLPDKLYQRRLVQLTPEQQRFYKIIRQASLIELDDGRSVSAELALTKILRLHQIACGFVTDDEGQQVIFPNNPRLAELLQVLEETTGKVIIWSQYVHNLNEIRTALTELHGPDCCAVYAGETTPDQRQEIVGRFQDPTSPLRFFIGQIQTGGYGLTLTAASTVIYYSNSYSLEHRLQSEDRAHRIGQRNPVTYVDIVAEKTVDEKIVAALRDKRSIAQEVTGDGWREWI
jgi:SNF2 family DNA or RNA helicase